jgi:hypothetical protein
MGSLACTGRVSAGVSACFSARVLLHFHKSGIKPTKNQGDVRTLMNEAYWIHPLLNDTTNEGIWHHCQLAHICRRLKQNNAARLV